VSQKTNPATLGLFIVVGLALGVAGVLLFSSFKLFSKSYDIIAYFDESLNGLSEGAPVKYRGVTIGSVKRVMVRFNQATNDFAMPVIIEIQEHLLRDRLGDQIELFKDQTMAERVQLGLRASLQTESLVTGVLYIDIRPNPRAPPPVFHQLQEVYPELPTEPTQIMQLFNNLASLDIKGIENNLNTLLAKLDDTVDSLHMAEINRGVTNLLASLDRLVSSHEITNALASVRPAIEEYRLLGQKLNQRVDPVADGLTNSLTEISRTLAQFRGAGENLRTMLAPTSRTRSDLDAALEQLANAAQAITALADFLKQHPNALITGRQHPKPQP
jgi:paraquat-inducible protein B